MTARARVVAALMIGFFAFFMGGLLLATVEARRAAPASIEGVWSFVSETNTENGQVLHTDRDLHAIWIFSKRYYCLARMSLNRRSEPTEQLHKERPEEQVKYYEQLLGYASTAGTYRTDGTNLTRTWDISLGPDILGQSQVARYSIEGDRLTVDLPRRSVTSGPASRVVYRRLE